MMDDLSQFAEAISLLEEPILSTWTLYPFGRDRFYFSYKPRAGAVPNFFHRFMQRICFGFIWEKDK